MRTTIDIDDDVLAAAKELVRSQRVSAGHIVSRLAREALSGHLPQERLSAKPVGGIRPFPARAGLVTNAQVNDLRDQEGV